MPHSYDPNQPRVPQGRHEGGRWTSGDLGHTDPAVRLAFKDETDPWGRAQRPPALQIDPLRGRRFVPPPLLLMRALGAATPLFTLLSMQDSELQRAVLVFKAREYRRVRMFEFEAVQKLDWDEVERICGDKFTEIQKLVDAAYAEVKKDHPNWSTQRVGNEVHWKVAHTINAMGDENFKAEQSFVIRRDGRSPTNPNQQYEEVNKQGEKGSQRPDARLKKPEERLACIGDIKVGEKELKEAYIKGLLDKIGNNKDYDDIDRLFISEVRPTAMRLPRPKPTLER